MDARDLKEMRSILRRAKEGVEDAVYLLWAHDKAQVRRLKGVAQNLAAEIALIDAKLTMLEMGN